VISGNPITARDQDRLGRSVFADQIAARLRATEVDDGLVVAVMGPWGTGKTSVLNMVVQQLQADPARIVLTFNPWMFSGRDQLIAKFFEQIAQQVQVKLHRKDLAAGIAAYGQAVQPLVFVPVAGVWVARIGAIVSAIASLAGRRKKKLATVEDQRIAIEQALRELPEPVFVVIDDIDRLTATETRDMLQMVRLTAHFPKIVYLLAFDRVKVEQALGEDGSEDGRRFLHKIVEVGYDVPEAPAAALQALLLTGLEEITAGQETGPFQADRWLEVFHRVIRPLLGTPRDIIRYLAALPAMVAAVGDEVCLVDLLALEAIRMQVPDVFARLGSMAQALTDVGMLTSSRPGWQDEIGELLDQAGEYRDVIAELCRLLFPATERYLGNSNKYWPSDWLPRWRKDRRVASPEILGFYLSKQLPAGILPAGLMDRAVLAMDNEDEFRAAIDAMTEAELEDFLARLPSYEQQIPLAAVRPAVAVLLSIYPRLRAGSRSVFDPGPEIAVDRLVLQLLRRIDDDERAAIVEALCADVPSFTGRMHLLRNAGRRPNPQFERLVDAELLERLYQQLCYDIRHARAAELLGERDVIELLSRAVEEDPSDRDDLDQLLVNPDVAEAVLLSARGVVHTNELGQLAVREEIYLRWQLLAIVVGDDQAIEDLVDRVAAKIAGSGGVAADFVDMARRYLTGWRPDLDGLSERLPVVRSPLNSPNMIFSPATMGQWPALLVRAVTTYEVDPAAQADVSGRAFHDEFAAALTRTGVAEKIAAIAADHGLPAMVGSWQPDSDAVQRQAAAVQHLIIGEADHPSASLRYAILLPEPGGPLRLITDVAVSPSAETDAKWGKLTLTEVCDVLVAGLRATVGEVAEQVLTSIYSGELPPRDAIEFYVWSAQGQSNGRATTLATTIDLDPLGSTTRSGQPPQQGLYAVAADIPTGDIRHCRHLVTYALIRMAMDWGYLDGREAIARLVSS